jgi:enoyl-CoA hydratase/carnithine racemase
MSKKIVFELKQDIAVIKLNNPKKLNAWDFEMRSQIISLIKKIKKNKNIKALIFTGYGVKAFCSGQDLKEIKNFKNSKIVFNWINQFKTLYKLIRSLEIPTIAAINGVAAGSGFQLALLTDIRVSYSKVKMGQVEINSGIVSVIGPWIIEKILGLNKAIELSLSGRLINGAEAYKIGAINHLVSHNSVLKSSIKIAKELANKPSNAMRLTKKRIWEMFSKDFDQTFKKAMSYHKKSFKLGEPQSGSKNFFEKK